MRPTHTIGFVVLLLLSGCKHQLDSRPAAVSSPEPAQRIVVGLSMDDVIKLHGRHYRLFQGPLVGDIALVYDDVTVQVRSRVPGKERERGVVYLVSPTPRDVDWFVGEIPYEDAK